MARNDLTCWTKKSSGGEEKKWERVKGEKKEEKKRKEKLPILSSFPVGPTVGVRRSKRQSSSSWRELRVGTRIREFQQTPRGRGFSYSVLLLA